MQAAAAGKTLWWLLVKDCDTPVDFGEDPGKIATREETFF